MTNKNEWYIDKVVNETFGKIQDGLATVMVFLEGEAVKTTSGQRGSELKAVDKGQLIASYDVSVSGLTGILTNLAEYYIYVHYGTAPGKPGQTQPRPIITLVLDRNIENIEKIIQRAINS